MENSNAVRFIEIGYILAIVSSSIIFLSLLFGLLGLNFLANIVWLALITAGVGLFLSILGRNEFNSRGGVPEDLAVKSRVGFRINLGILAIMLFIVIFYIIFALRFAS